MFRTVAAAAAALLLGSHLGADEKVSYDHKLTHVRLDPSTKKELGRKDGVEARAIGDPVKGAQVAWDVRASTFKTLPAVGDIFLDEKGHAWAIGTVKELPGGKEYLFECRRLAQPPVPPGE